MTDVLRLDHQRNNARAEASVTVWALKECTLIEWDRVQTQLADLQFGTTGSHKLIMLVKTGKVLASHSVVLGLPDASWLGQFPGFQETTPQAIPDGVSLIVCRHENFDRSFPEIAAKLARI